MMKKWLLVLVVLMEGVLGVFPKVLWTYVPQLEEMTALQTLCVDNLRRHAALTNMTFRFITNHNYTFLFKDWHEVATIAKVSHLDHRATLAAIIQLKVLHEYGGIWIEPTAMLTESLQWLDNIEQSEFANNREKDQEVVMFYEGSWFDRTEEVSERSKEKVVVVPNYHSWFMMVVQGSAFIKDLNNILTQTLMVSYQNSKARMKVKGVDMDDSYLEDPSKFIPWLISTTVSLKQMQLDKGKTSSRRLAVSHYHISAVESSQTAFLVDRHAKDHVDLTTKYLAELNSHQLPIQLKYIVKFSPQVGKQLLSAVERDYVDLDNFHSAAQMLCDGAEVPLRYVLNNSILERFLLRGSEVHSIPVYEEEYIRHHCRGSFIEAYLQFGKFFLIVVAIVGHVYISRKAILFFKPEWGRRKRRVEFEEASGESD